MPGKDRAPAVARRRLAGRPRAVSARPRALRRRVDRVERLAGGHEQAVALGAAEADVAADLREADASDQLALRSPDGHAAVTHGAARVARAPEIAVDVAADAIRPALHPVDHEVAE